MTAMGRLPRGSVHAVDARIGLADLAHASSLGGRLEALRGRCVLIATRDQLAAALALIELDGVARRMVLCPSGLPQEHLSLTASAAGADALVSDEEAAQASAHGIPLCVTATPTLARAPVRRDGEHETEWILLTSGTTGAPKLVLHTLSTLAGTLAQPAAPSGAAVWSTFYDIRRYGGLQIFLRAVLGGASLVLPSAQEPTRDFLARAGAAAVTHISGTPSHWRRALMSGAAHSISPQYVRLSGEIADQAVLDSLRAAYPTARIVHAFASIEAGLAFDVGDGLAGFPASLVGRSDAGVEMRVMQGTLRVRSMRNAIRYLDSEGGRVACEDGFVDTDDMVELREGRYHFVGRRTGVINVGGLKVHPEEVEAVINAHARVRMSLVKARKSPITGAIVAADIVLSDDAGEPGQGASAEMLRREIADLCRRALAAHKVPAVIRFVPTLDVSPSGKLVRPDA